MVAQRVDGPGEVRFGTSNVLGGDKPRPYTVSASLTVPPCARRLLVRAENGLTSRGRGGRHDDM